MEKIPSCVIEINNRGILFIGDGTSSISFAFQLFYGAKLVSDDYCEIWKEQGYIKSQTADQNYFCKDENKLIPKYRDPIINLIIKNKLQNIAFKKFPALKEIYTDSPYDIFGKESIKRKTTINIITICLKEYYLNNEGLKEYSKQIKANNKNEKESTFILSHKEEYLYPKITDLTKGKKIRPFIEGILNGNLIKIPIIIQVYNKNINVQMRSKYLLNLILKEY